MWSTVLGVLNFDFVYILGAIQKHAQRRAEAARSRPSPTTGGNCMGVFCTLRPVNEHNVHGLFVSENRTCIRVHSARPLADWAVDL